jgi:hypothetical protein
MTEQEEETYFLWYNRGKVVAEEVNRTIERVRKGFVSVDEAFLENAFFDGFRDNVIVDGQDE